MHDAAKAVLWTTLGFALGVAVVFVGGRYNPRPPLPTSAPVPSVTAPEIRREPTVTDQPEQTPTSPPAVVPLSPQSKLGSPDSHGRSNPDRSTDSEYIRLGRPEKPYEYLVKVPSWDEFYKQCSDSAVRGELLEDLIFRRLKNELNVDEATIEAAERLFKLEQMAAMRAIVDQYGGAKKFKEFVDRPDALTTSVYDGWRSQRDAVRAGFQSEYLRILTPDQLALFSRQLRNSEIALEAKQENHKLYYNLGGIGNQPK